MKPKSGMKLQEAVEQMRHDEDDQTKEIEKEVKQNLGLMFSMENTDIKLNRGILRVEGNCSDSRKVRHGIWRFPAESMHRKNFYG